MHVMRLAAGIVMIKENISLLMANTRRSVSSFLYPVPIYVRLGLFLVKI